MNTTSKARAQSQLDELGERALHTTLQEPSFHEGGGTGRAAVSPVRPREGSVENSLSLRTPQGTKQLLPGQG